MSPVISARELRSDRLVELTHGLRRALAQRGEYLPPTWVEEAAADLRAGRLEGWADPGVPGGLGILSPHRGRSVGHLHLEAGEDRRTRAEALLGALRAAPDAKGPRLDVGVTGLTDEDEARLASDELGTPGFSLVRRFHMVRGTGDVVTETGPTFSPGVRRLAVAEVPAEILAQLDWTAFRGTPDEAFVPETAREDQEMLQEILDGRLGRFLPEASGALVNAEDHLLGVLLTAEENPRSAIFLDLVIHPAHRRQGIGRDLLRWGIRAAAALGYHEVELWVTETNQAARRLYLALGFIDGVHTTIYRWSRATTAPQPQPDR